MTARTLESSAQLRSDLAAMWAAPVEVVEVPRRAQAPASAGTPLHTFAVLPSLRQPRIVATDSGAAVAAAVRRFNHTAGIGRRSTRVALAAGMRAGALSLVPRDRLSVLGLREGGSGHDTSLLDTLAEIFETEVSIGMSIGAVRANRKPVLQVLTRDGHTLGFAKLGLSPLARALVGAEAANLRSLARHDFQHLELPRLIHHGEWHGHELLVMTALHAPLRRFRAARALPARAMMELAECEGTSTWALAESPWFGSLVADAADAPDSASERFRSALGRLAEQYGDRTARFGSWHGDWGPWNMVWAGDRVRLWDCERFTSGVPYGLDALYYAVPLPAAHAGPARLREAAHRALAPLSLDRHEAELLLPLYVTALCARFVPDSLTEHGQHLRPTVAALLDLLGTLLEAGMKTTLPAPPTRIAAPAEEARR